MSQGTGARILVVDDVPVNTKLLTAYLVSAGYEVVAANSGEEALLRLADEPPDMVLLDVMMPHVDGLEVCRRIKGDPQTRHVPVILVTSLSAIDDKVRGQEAGADDFLSKPVQRIELLLRVSSLLRLKSLHDQLSEKVAQLELAEAQLRELAMTDALTELRNKRYLEEFMTRELDRARRYQRPLSLLITDIDSFKTFNDSRGHHSGDVLLQQVAALHRQTIRSVDLAARYGGEEFVIVLPETPLVGARVVAERLRRRVEEHRGVDTDGQPIGSVTISIGIATCPEDGEEWQPLFRTADSRLYQAKRQGRNRVSGDGVAEPVPVSAPELPSLR